LIVDDLSNHVGFIEEAAHFEEKQLARFVEEMRAKTHTVYLELQISTGSDVLVADRVAR
jgi:hypothetical protein